MYGIILTLDILEKRKLWRKLKEQWFAGVERMERHINKV
jgi:hypothetical protein